MPDRCKPNEGEIPLLRLVITSRAPTARAVTPARIEDALNRAQVGEPRLADYRSEATSPKHAADDFAAHLLMPHYLFRPLSRQHQTLTFKTVNLIAEKQSDCHGDMPY